MRLAKDWAAALFAFPTEVALEMMKQAYAKVREGREATACVDAAGQA